MDVHRVADAEIRPLVDDVVVAHSGGIRVFDRDTLRRKAARDFDQHFPQIAIDADGTLFYHDWQNVFQVNPGQLPSQQNEAVVHLDGARILDIAVAKNGGHLAVLNSTPAELQVYSTTDFSLQATFTTDFNNSTVRFTEDGQRLLVGLSTPGLARVFDLATRTQVGEFDSLPLDLIETDDHRWLVTRGGGFRVVDASDPYRPSVGMRSSALAKWKLPSLAKILVSPDGSRIATETLNPRAALVLDRSEQTPLRLLPGLNRQPESRPLAYSHDGRYLVTERGRSNVTIWDLQALDTQLESFIQSAPATAITD
ncbi:hypothetical protein K227x_53690 [Rubripirellula lacrimiformis]|uniref:WD domain, G-beta repeat n=1 Tax=Rubripirellula lacrimiformis TaxID=1930273 RepID=A0A517NII1_9BACT|nr:WD40 repeat domain-containing protein [Rubripirellula lacrimiformis]QDT06945.1 hypothetical protein K227x_53690 [Rubripirellula lacrimiformis]